MNSLNGALIRYWDWDCFGIKWKPYFIMAHQNFGVISMLLCALTYTTGISTWRFTDHLPLRVQTNFKNVIGFIVAIYTVILIFFPVMKFFAERGK